MLSYQKANETDPDWVAAREAVALAMLRAGRVAHAYRTVRAAMDALFDQGRPSRVQLLVLIDRGWRELPIEARFVGRMVQTGANEIIEVKFQEIDGMEKVLLVEKMAQGA